MSQEVLPPSEYYRPQRARALWRRAASLERRQRWLYWLAPLCGGAAGFGGLFFLRWIADTWPIAAMPASLASPGILLLPFFGKWGAEAAAFLLRLAAARCRHAATLLEREHQSRYGGE